MPSARTWPFQAETWMSPGFGTWSSQPEIGNLVRPKQRLAHHCYVKILGSALV